jgi:hypothetical protein
MTYLMNRILNPTNLKTLSKIVGYTNMKLLTLDYSCDKDRNNVRKCELRASYKFANDTIYTFKRTAYEESKDVMMHHFVEDVEMILSQ